MWGFSYLTLLAAVSAVSAIPAELVSRAEATIGQIGGISIESAQVVLVNACTDTNFGGCISLNFATIPTGCITVPARVNNAISGAQALAGIRCTFFDAEDCSGRSVVVAGDIANLASVGMNDRTSSVSCRSTAV
ncbi:hypothetical protein C8J57DRAFT_1484110 [Mycena rebaudengoi]|nr:hypothetical protein C8J57DRAFT_1484110 [Mycena rebaudengoi]